MKKENKLVAIHWRDASGLSEGNSNTEWFSKERLIELGKETYEELVISCGILLERNKDYAIIAATYYEDSYADVSMIPARNIVRIQSLK